MCRRKCLLSLVFLTITVLTFGQINNDKADEQSFIEVIGTAEKEIVPDEIYIKIVIHEKYNNKMKLTIEEQEKKLKDALTSLNIDLKNLFISDVNGDYVRISWQKKDMLTKKEYTLKVSDALTVSKVFQSLDKLEISDANISRVTHSKLDSLQKEVKITAIKAAKEKAVYLLNAIGENIGKPLIIKENVYFPYESSFANASSNIKNNTFEEYFKEDLNYSLVAENVIQFSKIKIHSSIYIKYSIK